MKVGKKEKEFLYDISCGDIIIGFLGSGGSTHIMYKGIRRARDERVAKQARKRILAQLIQKNIIAISGVGKKKKFRITSMGKNYMARHNIITNTNKHPTTWDGKWRMIMFDVPVRYSAHRIDLRNLLIACGFYQVQQSVYVFPYDCNTLLQYITQHKQLRYCCQSFVGDYVGDDTRLRSKFKL